MQYVNVLKNSKPYTDKLDMMPSVLKNNKHSLISLRSGYDSDITKEKVVKFHDEMCRFNEKYKAHSPTTWIDSGGYHFITGKFNSTHIPRLIEVYHYYLDNYSDDFDYIFSLDFPFNKKDDVFNKSLKAIKTANSNSLQASLRSIENNNELARKFYFIHQFLAAGFYDIWRELYRRHEVHKFISNFAIGGMVGIRAGKPAVPSPFIGMSYRILLDFFEILSIRDQQEFRLHFLGVYLLQDRFSIILLEKLFAKYLLQAGKDVKPVLTYDSSTYTRRGKRRHYSMSGYFEYDGGFRFLPNFDDINLAGSLKHAEERHLKYLKRVYSESVIDVVREVMDKSPEKRLKKLRKDIQSMVDKDDGLKNNSDAGHLEIYDPISILSDSCIDKILLKTIDRYDLADELFGLNTKDDKEVKKFADDFILKISHAGKPYSEVDKNPEDSVEASLFNSASTLWSIRQCIVKIYEFHRWMIGKKGDTKRLDKMILEYNSFFKKEVNKKSVNDSSEEND